MVHYYLDLKQTPDASFLYFFFNPIPYFLPYRKKTDAGLLKWKQGCNLLLGLTIISLAMNIIMGLIIYAKY